MITLIVAQLFRCHFRRRRRRRRLMYETLGQGHGNETGQFVLFAFDQLGHASLPLTLHL